jgi:hypothetical protein
VYRGIDNLWAGTFDNDREDLLEVTTKDHSETTKRHIRVTNISTGTIKCLLTVSMLHCDLIIDHKKSLLDQLCLKKTSLDAAERVFIYSNRDFEARVRSVTTHKAAILEDTTQRTMIPLARSA